MPTPSPQHKLQMSQTGLIRSQNNNKNPKEFIAKCEQIIDNFCSKIVLDKEINHDEIGKLLELLNSDTEFPKLLVDKIISVQKEKMMLRLLNYENLHHFASILNTITLNIELNENKSDYDVNFAIIYIAERTFFCNSGYVKTYLCSIISKNNIYSSKKFWTDLIYLKIYKKLDQIMQAAQESNLILSPSSSFNGTYSHQFSSLSTETIVNNTGLLSNIGNKFIGYFTNSNQKSNIELSDSTLNKIEKSKIHEITTIIKEFIPHFSNFNFEIGEAIDIIVELTST